ncbi:MAG: hypothetical protein K8R06_06915 [Methanosarcinales archaeon]|nr:hypothetical protein [Methanosarcinales archaeon]
MKFVVLLLFIAMLIIPVSASDPEISTWYNDRTNNGTLDLTVNVSETVKFNVTANQSIDTWNWTDDGVEQIHNYDNFSISWNSTGVKTLSVNATNNTNTSNTIIWNITVKKGDEDEETKDKNATILSWSSQVVDYIYVNDTLNETITYSLTTNESMTEYNWTVDGVAVTGADTDNTYNYTHIWDNQSTGFHTVVFTGNNAGSRVEFRWYVNVYEEGSYSSGCIFDIIDKSLENHATEIKIRIFKRNMNKHNLGADYFAQKVNRLHDEIAKRQMTREALREDLKTGEITQKEYVAALKQAQNDAKDNSKSAKNNPKSGKANAKQLKNK